MGICVGKKSRSETRKQREEMRGRRGVNENSVVTIASAANVKGGGRGREKGESIDERSFLSAPSA